jgi:hypothetical protein
LDATQQQVTQVFADAGFPNPVVSLNGLVQNLYATSHPSGEGLIFYQITFSAAPSALASLAIKLDALAANPPLGYAYLQYSAGLTASAAAVNATRTAMLPQLLSEARIKAQSLASIASLKLGSILGISDSGYASTPYLAQGGFSSYIPYDKNGTVYTLYLSVKFGAQ